MHTPCLITEKPKNAHRSDNSAIIHGEQCSHKVNSFLFHAMRHRVPERNLYEPSPNKTKTSVSNVTQQLKSLAMQRREQAVKASNEHNSTRCL